MEVDQELPDLYKLQIIFAIVWVCHREAQNNILILLYLIVVAGRKILDNNYCIHKTIIHGFIEIATEWLGDYLGVWSYIVVSDILSYSMITLSFFVNVAESFGFAGKNDFNRFEF